MTYECGNKLHLTKGSSERRKRMSEAKEESESKRLRLNDENREESPHTTNLDEGTEDDQKEIMEQLLKKEADAKSPLGDSSFKENPYIYLSLGDPALISCL